MSKKVRVCIVDPHPMFRIGLETVLSREPDFMVVGSGDDASHLPNLIETQRPELVLVDTQMNGGGIKLAAEARRVALNPVHLVFLTASERYEDVTAALQAGASGYILKAVSKETLLNTLRLIISGETYVTPQLASRLLKSSAESKLAEPLSGREFQILTELSSGHTNKEIARNVGISEKTVKHYVGRILQKLSVRNRTEAVIAARSLGSREPLQPAHNSRAQSRKSSRLAAIE